MPMSIQEAVKKLFASKGWNTRIAKNTINNDWEKIVGKTINRYTKNIQLVNDKLVIDTDIPILKHEIMANKRQLIDKINRYYKSTIVNDIIVR